MVSKTRHTWTVRDNKKKNQGRARKNALANKGTTLPADELFKVVDKKKDD